MHTGFGETEHKTIITYFSCLSVIYVVAIFYSLPSVEIMETVTLKAQCVVHLVCLYAQWIPYKPCVII